jgi:hypothetical protein
MQSPRSKLGQLLEEMAKWLARVIDQAALPTYLLSLGKTSLSSRLASAFRRTYLITNTFSLEGIKRDLAEALQLLVCGQAVHGSCPCVTAELDHFVLIS